VIFHVDLLRLVQEILLKTNFKLRGEDIACNCACAL
jgi:hypothetical protein